MGSQVQIGWAAPARFPMPLKARVPSFVPATHSRFAPATPVPVGPQLSENFRNDAFYIDHALGIGDGRSTGGNGDGGRGDREPDDWGRWQRVPVLVGPGIRRMRPSAAVGGSSGGEENPFLNALRRLRISHVLLAVNVAVFLLQGALGGGLLLAGAKVNSQIAAGQLHRLLTPMFLHASMSHLAVNSFSLYSTGPAVESWFGRLRFMSLYVVSGICGNVLSYFCTPTPSVGASGAIFGLVGATAVVLARHRRILGPRSRKGLNSLAYIVLMNFGMGMSPGSRVDNFGHLGGLLGGIAFAYLLGPRFVPARTANGKTVLVDRSILREAWDDAKLFFSGSAPRKPRR